MLSLKTIQQFYYPWDIYRDIMYQVRACSLNNFFLFTDTVLFVQISRASLTPESSYIAKPAASWLDDFLVWISPEAFGCCRKFTNATYCPPDDQVSSFILNKYYVVLSDICLIYPSYTSLVFAKFCSDT